MNKTDRVTISDQKFEALRLCSLYYSSEKIAKKMQISEATARYYVSDAIKRVNKARIYEHRLCRNFK